MTPADAMAENRYWFARQFPVGHPRRAMAPVSPAGWRAVWIFAGCMLVGSAAAAILVPIGIYNGAPLLWIAGGLLYLIIVGFGFFYLINVIQTRGDHSHTVDDYKAGRV